MEHYLKLRPVVKTPIWGQERWVIAAHEHGDSEILNGAWQGKTLNWLWQHHREYFGGMRGDRFPLLIKEITAEADLSIQVHPDNAYAYAHENGASGKSECWYILKAREGASLIMGHNAQSREEAERFVREGRWKEFLREVPVQAGDFFQIDAGCIHSIKGGIRLLEIQQNSDITYRLYDYDRLDQNGKKRRLHLEKSLDVIRYAPPERPQSQPRCLPGGTLTALVENPYYRVDKLEWRGDGYTLPTGYPFLCLSVLEGEGMLQHALPIQAGDHLLLPGGQVSAVLNGNLSLLIACPQI